MLIYASLLVLDEDEPQEGGGGQATNERAKERVNASLLSGANTRNWGLSVNGYHNAINIKSGMEPRQSRLVNYYEVTSANSNC